MSRIGVFYFTGTAVTKIYSEWMQQELKLLNSEVTLYDISSFSSRNTEYDFQNFDALIFGFPVYSDFAPSVIIKWIKTLQGKQKPCGMFFTYGARTSGYAHFHTKELLEAAGFRVLLSAEFLGRHTFNVGGWTVLPDRPDSSDQHIAKQYTQIFLDKLKSQMPETLWLQKPFGYKQAVSALNNQAVSNERNWFHPSRKTKSCSMCRLCETGCPAQAFDAVTGQSNPEKCIKCMRCLSNCPDRVIVIDEKVKTVAYPGFLNDWCLNDNLMKAKCSKIIQTPADAAQ